MHSSFGQGLRGQFNHGNIYKRKVGKYIFYNGERGTNINRRLGMNCIHLYGMKAKKRIKQQTQV